jgi:hypothetical protein
LKASCFQEFPGKKLFMRAIEKVYDRTVIIGVTRKLYYWQPSGHAARLHSVFRPGSPE